LIIVILILEYNSEEGRGAKPAAQVQTAKALLPDVLLKKKGGNKCSESERKRKRILLFPNEATF
jgi:hypothetical protein